MQVKTELGMWLEEQRRTRGMTKGKAAELIGVSPAQYSSYEHGKSVPRSKTIQKIAEAFSLSVDEVRAMLVPAQQNEGGIDGDLASRVAMLEAKVDYAINLLQIIAKK